MAIEKDLKESLAGRYELIRVEHWNFSEAKAAFDSSLSQFIEFGCYPGSMGFPAHIVSLNKLQGQLQDRRA